jgi:myxalamid-type polyketide synthase MxaC
LICEITSNSGEDQIAWRGSARHVARLVTAPHMDSVPIEFITDGAYVITGGLGGLGVELARWLVERHARHIVLIGRQGFVERAKWNAIPLDSEDHWRAEAIQAMEASGVRIDIEKADVGDRDQMERVFCNLATRGVVVRGVFHAATLFDFRLLHDIDVPSLRAMLRAKVEGSWNLHELTKLLPLDFFVMFSSGTALVGAKASAHYAAGNQFLDALAHHRRSLGLPALSIDWGEWEKTRGITAEQRRLVENSGWRPMNVATALAAMGDLMGTAAVQQMVAALDVDVIKAAYQIRGRRPFLDELRTGHSVKTMEEKNPSGTARAQMRAGSPREQAEMVETIVTEEVKRVMGLSSSDTVERDRGLFEMGLDSLMSVKLRMRLEAAFGASLSSSAIFNHPTVGALAVYLTREVLKVNPEETSPSLPGGPDLQWDAMAKEIADLSDEEVRAEVAREAQSLQTEYGK